MDWFTADNHFYHKNIIKLCSRPFETLEDMRRALIDNWNTRVDKKDTVWHYSLISLHPSMWQKSSTLQS